MSDNTDVKLGTALLVLCGAILLMIVGPIWGGYVFQHLWNWFAPPFTTVRLSLAEAVGLSCLATVLRGYRYRNTPKGESGKEVIFGLLMPAILLLTGYIAHSFMVTA